MSSVSVFCAPNDQAFGDKIAKALLLEGHAVRRANAEQTIEGLQQALTSIVIWSPNAANDDDVCARVDAAQSDRAVIPVLIGAAPPPEGFAGPQPVDLTGWAGDAKDPRWRFVIEEIELASQKDFLAEASVWPDSDGDPNPPLVSNEPVANVAAPQENSVEAFGILIDEAAHDLGEGQYAALPLENYTDGESDELQGELFGEVTDDDLSTPEAALRKPDRNAPFLTRRFPVRHVALGGAVLLAICVAGAMLFAPSLRRPTEATPSIATVQPAGEAPVFPGAVTPIDVEGLRPGPVAENTTPLINTIAEPAVSPPIAGDAGDGYVGSSAAIDNLAEIAPDPINLSAEEERQILLVRLTANADLRQRRASGETANLGGYVRDCFDCPDLAVIPAGSFVLGAPSDEPSRLPAEGPQVSITLDRGFAIATREVTFEQWDACVADGGCMAYSPSDAGWGRGDQPVVNVSYEDAERYAFWLSQKTGRRYRLPTEVEWEYAARAGNQSPYAFGVSAPVALSNFEGASIYQDTDNIIEPRPLPAGSFAPNAFGLFDMHGNVWEWTGDCWTPDHQGRLADGRPAAGDCSSRVLKGGAFNTGAWRMRSAHRIRKPQTARESDQGFRVVRDL